MARKKDTNHDSASRRLAKASTRGRTSRAEKSSRKDSAASFWNKRRQSAKNVDLVKQRMARELARAQAEVPEKLTKREHDVAILMVLGLTNEGISEALRVSAETIKTHIVSIFARLRASTRADAVTRLIMFKIVCASGRTRGGHDDASMIF